MFHSEPSCSHLVNIDSSSDDEQEQCIASTKKYSINNSDKQNNKTKDNGKIHTGINDEGDEVDDEERPIFIQPRIQKENPYESLDYDICENALWFKEESTRNKFLQRTDFFRWWIFIIIGICVALIAAFVDISVEEISRLKYSFIRQSIKDNMNGGNLSIPYFYYALINMGIVLIGALLVTYIEPIAGGSGVPIVKCYLNGIKVPRIVRIKTLFVKIIGVVMSVAGSLAGGKEGPMIHAGAVVGAGISQGKSTTFNRDFKVFQYFRNDHEKRDFVVGGTSAGVAAAFGAPIGGVLFALEEGASFWNQSLIWKTLVSSIISSFTLNVCLSAYHNMKTFSYPGLFNFGQFEPIPFEFVEIPIFVLMGIFGGLTGALWNYVNTQMSIFRSKYFKPKWSKIIEVLLMAFFTSTIAFLMIFFINDCRSTDIEPIPYPVQLFCSDNEYNVMASLWFQTPEASVKAMFHDPPGSYEIWSLFIYALVYYPLSCLTFGLSVSIGIFIPSLLVGATWGRIIALLLAMAFPSWTSVHPSKYALIGAAAQLGGVLRMTISLTVILIESTGNVSFALPLLITLISAKWMGDYFNEGIYDIQIKISNIPMLPWHISQDLHKLKAINIMTSNPLCISTVTKVSHIIDILKNCSHNGFPVIETKSNQRSGHLKGIILRYQLIVILKNKFFVELQRFNGNEICIEKFRQEYPRYPSIDKIKIDTDKADFTVDLTNFMNPTPYTATEEWSVPRVFQTFRALGLRHIVVVDSSNYVRGIITRKDFLRESPPC